MKVLVALVCVVGICCAQNGVGVPGGISDADIHNAAIQGYANDFLTMFNRNAANGETFEKVTVLKARQQVMLIIY